MKNTPKKQFSMNDGRVVHYVPIEGETYSWEARLYEPPIELTTMEKSKCKAFGYDEKKVLIAKQLLLKNKTAYQIEKETGISRTSIGKYKKILSLMNDDERTLGDESTFIAKNVQPNLLIFMILGDEWTFSVFLILAPIFLLAIVGYFKHKWGIYTAEQEAHREEANKLYYQFTIACNLSFRQEPIVCNSKKEADYYKKLLVHYNNQARMVHFFEIAPNQTPNMFFNKKEIFSRTYCITNRHLIAEGRNNLSNHWKNCEESGLLDFLYTPKRNNWEQSKVYLYDAVEFLSKNPRPSDGDRARQKQIIELIPNI